MTAVYFIAAAALAAVGVVAGEVADLPFFRRLAMPVGPACLRHRRSA